MTDFQFHLKLKGEKAKEGEAILFRSDKFKYDLFYFILLSQLISKFISDFLIDMLPRMT
jgi:hypothetical protein